MYIAKLKNIANDSKYTNWYIGLIKSAPHRRPLGTYTEGHHILPKCFNLGGETDKQNIVYLSAREHYVAHQLLSKMMISTRHKHQMYEAFAVFSNNTRRGLKMTSRRIASIREANAIASSVRNIGNEYWKHRAPDSDAERAFKSKVASSSRWVNDGISESFTRDHDALIADGWVYGRKKFSAETLRNMKTAAVLSGKSTKGMKRTPEQCERIRAAALNRKPKSKD